MQNQMRQFKHQWTSACTNVRFVLLHHSPSTTSCRCCERYQSQMASHENLCLLLLSQGYLVTRKAEGCRPNDGCALQRNWVFKHPPPYRDAQQDTSHWYRLWLQHRRLYVHTWRLVSLPGAVCVWYAAVVSVADVRLHGRDLTVNPYIASPAQGLSKHVPRVKPKPRQPVKL